MTLMVRNALFQRVRLAALDKAAELGALDEDWGFGEFRWGRVLDAFYGAHEDLLTDADARSAAFLEIDDSDELSEHVWHVHQIFHDSDGDHDFGIMADVDLDATQDGDGIVFKNYRAGSSKTSPTDPSRTAYDWPCTGRHAQPGGDGTRARGARLLPSRREVHTVLRKV